VHLAQLWPYPIKSLGGEPVGSARLREDGVAGDDLLHVQQHGALVTGPTRPGLLALRVRLSDEAVALIEDRGGCAGAG
jgi:uncharacterized protein YcbX